MTEKYSQTLLDEIEQTTVGHYDASAESFWRGTRDHDVSQNIGAFLQHLPADEPLDILDFGCGPGRDLITFASLGHRAIGLDGSRAFVEMARRHSGCEVWQQQFLSLQLGDSCFDGIFANASLFHVPSQALPGVLNHCYRALRPDGILFMSNPRGDAEGWQGDRYGNYRQFDVYQTLLEQAGFTLLDHYYRPAGLPREQQPWLAIVSQKRQVSSG